MQNHNFTFNDMLEKGNNIPLLEIANPYYVEVEESWNPLDYYDKPEEDMYDIDEEDICTLYEDIEPYAKELGVNYPWERDMVTERSIPFGMEVGDDRVSASLTPLPLIMEVVVQERIFQMKTSWKDTCLSSLHWNFCEVTSIIPRYIEGSLNVCRKTGFDNVEFVDAPVMRLIGDYQKASRDHSSSAVGKSSLLAKKIRNCRLSCKPRLQLSNWIQDGCLRTNQSTEPKYLPWILGGSGATPVYEYWGNTFLYMLSYKHGTYTRVYATAIQELRNAVDDIAQNKPFNYPILSDRLRQKQEYLHYTYDNLVLVPQRDKISLKESIGKKAEKLSPIYQSKQPNCYTQGVVKRLIATRNVLDRRGAELEIAYSDKLAVYLFGTRNFRDSEKLRKQSSLEQRKEYEYALRGNSAAQRLLDRVATGNEPAQLIKDGWLVSTAGQRDLWLDQIRWVCEGMYDIDHVYTAEDIPQNFELYLTEELSLTNAMRVPDIPLISRTKQGIIARTTKAKFGLYQVPDQEIVWSKQVILELKRLRELYQGRPPDNKDILRVVSNTREYVSDDPIIIQLVTEAVKLDVRSIVIFTNDRKLVQHIAWRFPATTVIRMLPRILWFALKKNSVPTDREATGFLYEYRKRFSDVHTTPTKGFVDSGSYTEFLSTLQEDETFQSLERTSFLRAGIDLFGERWKHSSLVTRTFIDSIKYEVIDRSNHRTTFRLSESDLQQRNEGRIRRFLFGRKS
jgi:hypothetical protein